MPEQVELFGWLFDSDKDFTVEDVRDLIERVKLFNAGCIDEYLSKHVDDVFKQWLEEHK